MRDGIELLHHPADSSPRGAALLFVHGICGGAWLWQRRTLPFFARHGFDGYALSLSGHAGSRDRGRVGRMSLDHFADDVAEAAARIGGPVVVVGHSLGGAVVQNYLRRGGRADGVVLLCSVPPYGLARGAAEMFWTNPALWWTMALLSVYGLEEGDFGVLRDNLFPNGVGDADYDDFVTRVDDVAVRASFEASGFRPLAPLPWMTDNMLVIGGDRDRFLPTTDLLLTAAYYGVRPHVVERLGHLPMLDPRGELAEKVILDWLSERASPV